MSASTSLSRGRSLRIPAPDSLKPALPSQSQIAPIIGPSNLTLFLTNIRLLDFDLRSDWPDINAVTFSTKDVQQDQKKRIQCVEWALYHLFVIWDPDETRDKLKPFFPPLEHLQSLNLRTALYRCLDQVKKTGLLGRDTVLRKTMLDECKGERLEEVLAIFSAAVLKKVTQERNDGKRAPIAERLATESLSYTNDRTNLSTLIIAYKKSLRGTLAVKKESRTRLDDFADLLNLRERQIIRRHEQLSILIEEESVEPISQQIVCTLQDMVEKTWTGSNDWLETILRGDNWSRKEDLLNAPFDSVWSHVEDGTIGDLEYEGRQGLLEQLNSRIRQQSHRLAKWQSFEQTLATEKRKRSRNNNAPDLAKREKGIDLGFSVHKTLQLMRSPMKTAESRPKPPLREYIRLIENMQADLASVGTTKSPTTISKRILKALGHDKAETPMLPENLIDVAPSSQQEHHSDSDSDTDAASHRSDNDAKSISQTPPSEHIVEVEDAFSPTQPINATTTDDYDGLDESLDIPSTTRHTSLHPDMPPPSLPSPTASPLASEILASVLTTSPSPTKPRHVLSLAERTRLSMFRVSLAKSSYHIEDSEDSLPELVSNPLPQKLKRTSKSIVGHHTEAVDSTPTHEGQSVQEDLIARTRLSMANFATVQKNAQIDRRRSIKAGARNKRESRSSYFPKPLEPAVEDEDLMLDGVEKKKLIDGEVEVDQDIVFKSRPRIKTSPETSPQHSPVKAWGEMGARGDVIGSSSPMSEEY